MPIPVFDGNLVLPPHLGSPATDSSQLSPYLCTTVELCERFGTTDERREILKGLLRLREMLAVTKVVGFQLVAGSFVEDIEAAESRPPHDVDVLTIVLAIPEPAAVAANANALNRTWAKTNLHVDHIPIDAGWKPEVTVEEVRYWLGLFTHKRNNVWKGLLRLSLNTPAEDAAALAVLNKAKP